MSEKEPVEDEVDESEIVLKSCNISDDYLKEVSELFGNPNSRQIILLLVENEMYVNQISIKLKIRVSLVSYHLKKLGKLGFLTKTEKPISRKTKNHTFYKIDVDAFTVTLRKNLSLKKIFKETVKFVSVGIAGITTWFATNIINKPNIARGGINEKFDLLQSDILLPIIFTGMVVGFGLIIIYYSKKHK